MSLLLSRLAGTLRNSFRMALATFNAAGLTVARTITVPDKSGTLAMLSDLVGVGTLTLRVPHTIALSGVLTNSMVVAPFFIPVPSGQTAKLVSVRHKLASGTSVSIAIKKNGTDITGLGAVSVTPTAATSDPTSPESFANNDYVSIAVSSATGSPSDLSLTLYFEYSITFSAAANTHYVSDVAEPGVAPTAAGADAIAMGDSASAAGSASVASGFDTNAASTRAVAIGAQASVSQNRGVAIGDQASVTDHSSVALGYLSLANKRDSTVLNGGVTRFPHSLVLGAAQAIRVSQGDRQFHIAEFQANTTDATQTIARAGGVDNAFAVSATYAVEGLMVARQYAGAGGTVGDSKMWSFKFCVKKVSGTTSLVGTPVITEEFEDVGANTWALAIEADDTNDIFVPKVTGEASKSITWEGHMRVVECG